MAFRDCFIAFFLIFLCLGCLSISTLAGPHVVVDIRNDIPNESDGPLKVRCTKSFTDLKPGNHLKETLTVDQDLECTGSWARLFNTWDAFVATKDKGHNTVYWSIRKDGFYRSFDGSNWKLEDHWYTE